MNKLLIIISLLAFASCSKTGISDDFIPACIEDKILEFRTDLCSAADIYVKEYSYQNEIVYLFDKSSCDSNNKPELIDAKCNSLGFVELTSKFEKSAVFIRTIFEQ